MIDVSRRDCDVGMPQLLLNQMHGQAFVGQFDSVTVSKAVGMDSLLDAGFLRQARQKGPNVRLFERLAGFASVSTRNGAEDRVAARQPRSLRRSAQTCSRAQVASPIPRVQAGRKPTSVGPSLVSLFNPFIGALARLFSHVAGLLGDLAVLPNREKKVPLCCHSRGTPSARDPSFRHLQAPKR